MKRTATLLISMSLLFQVSAQNNNKLSNPEALIELVMFADLPGFRDSISFNVYTNKLDWSEKDGWNFTNQHEDYELFAYKVIYSKNATQTMASYESTNGTGQFARLFQVGATDSTYHLIKLIAGGDRCNGAPVANSYKLIDQTLTYSVLITPEKMMNLLGKIPLTNYFSDCMVCCVGEAFYNVNLATGKEEFMHVLLTETLDIHDQFDVAYMERVNQEKRQLNRDELTEFIREVLKQINTYNAKK